MIELEAISGAAVGNRIVTNMPYVSIGRSPASNFVIADPRVSWHHGKIEYDGQDYVYVDLRSTHGTLLRRGEIDRPVESVKLSIGDVLILAGAENDLRVNWLSADEDVRDDPLLTIQNESARGPRFSEDIFVDDAGALRAFLALERSLTSRQQSGRAGMLQSLIDHLANLYPELDYAAVLEEKQHQITVVQSLTHKDAAFPRTSSSVCRRAAEVRDGILFEVRGGQLVTKRSVSVTDLSPQSATIEHNTTGICIPLETDIEEHLFLQLERAVYHGAFTSRDLDLVHAMASRTSDRIRHLAILERYNAASYNAALGIFAQMLAHDIKGSLTFAPYVWEKLADASKHADIARGVETAYQLACSLQAPSRSDVRIVMPFSVRQLVDALMKSFASQFEGRCRFESHCASSHDEVTGHAPLLGRVLWNLVLNAYNAHENRDCAPPDERVIRVRIDSEKYRRVWITVEDNAGGLSGELMMFFQEAFEMIRTACEQQMDILRIVELVRMQEGAPNRVGLFFTAIAVNDMHGVISVQSNERSGTAFRIELPARIEGLKGLLQF